MLMLSPGLEHQLTELAQTIAPDKWMLVGGLMVHVHANAAAVPHSRPTNDVDVVLMPAAGTYTATATLLTSIGYRPHESLDTHSPFHRFVRGAEIVDVMATEGRSLRFLGRAVLEVPGSRSASTRTVPLTLESGIVVRLPDIASALSIKGAAAQTDGFFRDKHVEDGLTLLACGSGVDLDLSKSMRRNLNVLIAALSEPAAWVAVPQDKRVRALQTIRNIRPDWNPPTGASGSGRIQRGTRTPGGGASSQRQGRDAGGRFDFVQRAEGSVEILNPDAALPPPDE